MQQTHAQIQKLYDVLFRKKKKKNRIVPVTEELD